MSHYKEETATIDKKTWKRASHIVLYNETSPRIEIHHENKTLFSDGTTKSDYLGQLNYTLTDPTILIPLINPETYEQTETTFSAGEFELLAASVYIWLAENQAENQNEIIGEHYGIN